jgi:hypothetical protein
MSNDMDPFARFVFERLDAEGKTALSRRLAELLSDRLTHAADFDEEVGHIVEDLRQVGHELFSIDEDVGRQVWGRDYTKNSAPGLLIEFVAPNAVDVTWEGEAAPS